MARRDLTLAFAGTPAFAATALQGLLDAGYRIPLVFTQPDRPAGRGMKLQASPVKQAAMAAGLAVMQPRSLRLDGRHPDDALQARSALEQEGVQCLVVAAYGLILPRWMLDLPAAHGGPGCLNIHASLLPRWRGAAPIQRAIEAGDVRTGVTIMRMDEGLDTGDMLQAESIEIRADETATTLHDRLAGLGARLIVDSLSRFARGEWQPRPQPADGVTYARKIDKQEAPIDWRRPAEEIERRIRAFDPFPGASFALDGESLKCWRAAVVPGDASAGPGQVLSVGEDGPVIACGAGTALCVREVQRPGGRRLPAAQALQGRMPVPGGRLGGRED